MSMKHGMIGEELLAAVALILVILYVPVSVSPTNTASSHAIQVYTILLEEPNTNTANWKAAGGDQVDPFTSKIFWMP